MTPSPRLTRTEWHWILVFTWSVCHLLKTAHSHPRILHSKTMTKAKKHKIKEGQGNCIWSCSRIQHWRWNLSGMRLRRSPEPRTGLLSKNACACCVSPQGQSGAATGERRTGGREAWSYSRREQKPAREQREWKERLCYKRQLMAQTLSLVFLSVPCDRVAQPQAGREGR